MVVVHRRGDHPPPTTAMITIDFLVTSLIVVLIPGTGVVFTVSTGLLHGTRASMVASFGCTLGIVPHLLAAVLGLAAVLHASALAFQVLKFAGVLYLLYLAYATWRDKTAFVVDAASARHADAWGLIVKAVLLNILNPKLSIFFLAFLPQFVSPETSAPLQQMLVLSGQRLPQGGDRVAARAGLVAAHFRRRVRGVGHQPGAERALKLRCGSTRPQIRGSGLTFDVPGAPCRSGCCIWADRTVCGGTVRRDHLRGKT
jgi:threonine/homoserine/homoserine lactone efflux protein